MRQICHLKKRVKTKGAAIGICVVLVMLLLGGGIARAGIFDLFSNEISVGPSNNNDPILAEQYKSNGFLNSTAGSYSGKKTTVDLAGVQAVAIPEPILLILLAAPIPLLYRWDKRT